jgi:glycine/D-amino acid oxidase-like deaminating enzyme
MPVCIHNSVFEPGEHPFTLKHATHYSTMLIEPAIFLNRLMEDFYRAGGSIKIKEMSGLDEVLTLSEPVIFNCTGLGARQLFADNELFPIKGQLCFVLPQKEVDYISITDSTYMFPRSDGIVLGGTFEPNNWDLTPDPIQTQRILREHKAFFASMKDLWS